MPDPCLCCPLPDCDDASPECPLRAAWVAVNRKRKSGLAVSARELEAARTWYNEVYYPEHRALLSEQKTARAA